MTWNRSCAHETRVEGAARSGEWTEDLREHVRTCQACGDLAFVAAALQEDARQSNDVRPLADVGQVWWVAQQQARRATVARATRPIAIIERIAGGCAGLAVVLLLIWAWPMLAEWGAHLQLALAVSERSSLGPIINTTLLGGGTLLASLLWFAVSLGRES